MLLVAHSAELGGWPTNNSNSLDQINVVTPSLKDIPREVDILFHLNFYEDLPGCAIVSLNCCALKSPLDIIIDTIRIIQFWPHGLCGSRTHSFVF